MSHRSDDHVLRPEDDAVTFQTIFSNLGFKGLANLSGWTAFGSFINLATGVRTYDSLAAVVGTFDPVAGSVVVTVASPAAPITVGKYRLVVTMVSPSAKKLTSPSPDQNQTFIEYRSPG